MGVIVLPIWRLHNAAVLSLDCAVREYYLEIVPEQSVNFDLTCCNWQPVISLSQLMGQDSLTSSLLLPRQHNMIWKSELFCLLTGNGSYLRNDTEKMAATSKTIMQEKGQKIIGRQWNDPCHFLYNACVSNRNWIKHNPRLCTVLRLRALKPHHLKTALCVHLLQISKQILDYGNAQCNLANF